MGGLAIQEGNQQQSGVKVSGFGGALEIFGGNALFFFLLLMLGVNIAVSFYEHMLRREEHIQILCGSKLGIFIYTTPKGSPIDWDRLPTDLYSCVPKFLFERPALPRGEPRQ